MGNSFRKEVFSKHNVFAVCATVAGLDYVSVETDITFESGTVSETVIIPILDDVVQEDKEMLIVTVSTSQPNVRIGKATATITILDNDGEFSQFTNTTIVLLQM